MHSVRFRAVGLARLGEGVVECAGLDLGHVELAELGEAKHGEHTDEVLKELGLEPSAIEELRRKNVV